jgi:hypothetical protein
MPVPALTIHGLMPAGIYTCTLGDACAALCWNARRRQIWDGLARFLAKMAQRGLTSPIYLDGSFVTDKERPGDVDLVLDLVGASADELREGLMLFAEHDAIKQEFDVDFWLNLPGHGQSDFSAFFQYLRANEAGQRNVRVDVRKGILRIEQWLDGLNS